MNSIIENFLREDTENNYLYLRFKLYDDNAALKELEQRFENYIFKLKFLSYIKKSMAFYSNKYRQKKYKQHNNELAILNVKQDGFEEESINTISDTEIDYIEEIFKPDSTIRFQDIIEDYNLLKAIEALPDRQKEILYKLIVLQKTERELTNELGVSKQAINKSKNKALERLRKELMEKSS